MSEIWLQMYELYPMYEISTHGSVRNMQTNKVLKIRNDYVFLRDKNNRMRWLNIRYLMAIHSKQLIEEKDKVVTNYLLDNDNNIINFIKNIMIVEYNLFHSMDALYRSALDQHEKYCA